MKKPSFDDVFKHLEKAVKAAERLADAFERKEQRKERSGMGQKSDSWCLEHDARALLDKYIHRKGESAGKSAVDLKRNHPRRKSVVRSVRLSKPDFEAIIQSAESERQIVRKDKTVIVKSGRKIPKGTIGKVFWVGTTPYGISVGLEANGKRMFIRSWML